MKRLTTLFITIVTILCFTQIASATTGTVTVAVPSVVRHQDGTTVKTYVISFIADVSAATVPSTNLATATNGETWNGYVVLGVTNPGATGPTDNYDIALNDSNGVDIFGAALANRDITVSEAAVPAIANRRVDSAVTLVITNNSVNSATGTITISIHQGGI